MNVLYFVLAELLLVLGVWLCDPDTRLRRAIRYRRAQAEARKRATLAAAWRRHVASALAQVDHGDDFQQWEDDYKAGRPL